MIAIRDKAGKEIHSSKNLRGIIAHIRRLRSKPHTIIEARAGGRAGGRAFVTWVWENGDRSETMFESSTVAQAWARNRSSSIQLIEEKT